MDVGLTYPVRWYQPGDDLSSHGVPGTYRVDDEGRIEAHVHSLFNGERHRMFGIDSSFPTLLQGQFDRDAVTLVGARVTAQRGGLTEQRDATLAADYALEGFAFLDPDDLAFTDFRLRFTDQDVWTGWDRFAVMVHDRRSLADVGAVLRDVPEIEARIDGGTLRLVDGSYVNQETGSHRWVLQSRSYFEFHFDNPVPIGEVFERHAYPLQVMLMSASGRLPGVASMAGTNTEWDLGVSRRHLLSRWFQVRMFHGPLNTPQVGVANLLHRLQDLDFGVHMPALLKAVDRHRFALGHYGLLHSDRFVGGHPVRFSVATQLLDAFDRTLHPVDRKKPSFDTRLKRLEDESGNLVDGIIGKRKWRAEVARLRNIVVHGDAHAHEVLRDQRPLVVGYEALLLLFEVRFLVEIGLTPERAKGLATARGITGPSRRRSPRTTPHSPNWSPETITGVARARWTSPVVLAAARSVVSAWGGHGVDDDRSLAVTHGWRHVRTSVMRARRHDLALGRSQRPRKPHPGAPITKIPDGHRPRHGAAHRQDRAVIDEVLDKLSARFPAGAPKEEAVRNQSATFTQSTGSRRVSGPNT